MGEPIVLRGLTKEEAKATAEVHLDEGATVVIDPGGGGEFTVHVTYPEPSIATTPPPEHLTAPTPRDEADLIPDWAAVAVFLGAVLGIVGFVAAWVTEKSWAPILLTIGLIVAVIGMRAAEKAINLVPNGAR